MTAYRVTLIVDRLSARQSWRSLPAPLVGVGRRADGDWELQFDSDGDSFDSAAGRLWGEAAACGLEVLGVGDGDSISVRTAIE